MKKHHLKILFSNFGYARGIDGTLARHVLYMHRHVYASKAAQRKALCEMSEIILRQDPDICCFVEIDRGSFSSAGLNQLDALIDPTLCHFDIECKYGECSRLRNFFITKGKSLAFIARHPFAYEKLYFENGTKRLIYKVCLAEGLTLFFAHFSLSKAVRKKQFLETRELMFSTEGEVVFLGDFNILTGMDELEPLLKDSPFVLLNSYKNPTFKFHKRNLVLDLCICTKGVAERSKLDIVPQPYADHDALVLDIRT